MSVTYVFSPSTTILSSQVNTNFTDITSGSGLTGFSFDVHWNNNVPAVFKDTSGADGFDIFMDATDNGILKMLKAGQVIAFQNSAGQYLFSVDTSDNVVKTFVPGTGTYAGINQTGTSFGQLFTTDGDIYIGPSANGKVVIDGRMPVRSQSTNTFVNSFTQRGWGYLQGNGSSILSAPILFNLPFTSSDIALEITPCGQRPTSAGTPTGPGWFNNGATGGGAEYDSITTTGFNITLESPSPTNYSSANFYGFTWTAIGHI